MSNITRLPGATNQKGQPLALNNRTGAVGAYTSAADGWEHLPEIQQLAAAVGVLTQGGESLPREAPEAKGHGDIRE